MGAVGSSDWCCTENVTPATTMVEPVKAVSLRTSFDDVSPIVSPARSSVLWPVDVDDTSRLNAAEMKAEQAAARLVAMHEEVILCSDQEAAFDCEILDISDDLITNSLVGRNLKMAVPDLGLGEAKSHAKVTQLEQQLASLRAQNSNGSQSPVHSLSRQPISNEVQEFTVTLDKSCGVKLGLNVSLSQEDGGMLVVEQITGGSAEKWNSSNPASCMKRGDQILEVNGIRGDVLRLAQECKHKQLLELKLRHRVESSQSKNGKPSFAVARSAARHGGA